MICSGGNGKPCIDFFGYRNWGDNAAVEVCNVHAEIVWPSTDHDFINWNRQHFPQYQKYWASESTLNQTPSDHDPLRATLTIKEKSSLTFYMTYCDSGKEENKQQIK